MKIWLLDEGTPGHTVQTRGIGEILERCLPATTRWVTCRLRLRGWLRPVARFLVGRCSPARALALARVLYPGVEIPGDEAPGIVISSCGKSAYLNSLLSRAFSAKGVFIGEVRPFPSAWFDLVIVPVPTGAGNEIVMPVMETGVRPEKAVEAASRYWDGNPPEKCWSLLIGGRSRSNSFNDSDWTTLARAMNALAEKFGIRWLVTTSRRTGEKAENLIEAGVKREYLADAVWWSREPKKAVLAFLYAGERVFITQDSLTMMSEALGAGKRPVLLRPGKWNTAENLIGKYVGSLGERDLIDIEDLDHLEDFEPEHPAKVELGAQRRDFEEQLLARIDPRQT